MVPTTGEEWMGQVQARLASLERHRHPTPPVTVEGGGGGLVSAREIDGIDPEQIEVTTGNGAGNPYTRMHFRNYTFDEPFLTTPLPVLAVVTEPDAFGFEVTQTGMYQAHLEIAYSFSGTAPESVDWRFDCYSHYFEWTSTPSAGFGAVHGNGGAQETFTTPPFYEEGFNTLDGTHYMGASAWWRGIGNTMSSPFGGPTPVCFIYLFALGAAGGSGVAFEPGYNMEFVGDRLDYHTYVQPTAPEHRTGTLWYQT